MSDLCCSLTRKPAAGSPLPADAPSPSMAGLFSIRIARETYVVMALIQCMDVSPLTAKDVGHVCRPWLNQPFMPPSLSHESFSQGISSTPSQSHATLPQPPQTPMPNSIRSATTGGQRRAQATDDAAAHRQGSHARRRCVADPAART